MGGKYGGTGQKWGAGVGIKIRGREIKRGEQKYRAGEVGDKNGGARGLGGKNGGGSRLGG